MINFMKSVQTKITDFSIGSVARTLVEAPAIEIDELYQQMFQGLREAIPTSIYTAFDFGLLPAQPGSSIYRFTLTSAQATDTIIPAGSQARIPSGNVIYSTAATLTIPAGNTTGTVLIVANAVGVVGNTGAGTITELLAPVPNVASGTNLSIIKNGREIETETERQLRFRNFISTLARGTPPALRYGASTANVTDATTGAVTEQVRAVAVIEPWVTDPSQPIALVQVYVHNGVGSTSGALVAQARQVLYGYYLDDGTPVPGWKAAGVQTDVYAASDTVVNVAATIALMTGFVLADVSQAITDAITGYISALDVGMKVVYAELTAAVMAIEGVYDCDITTPSANVTVAANAKAVPGTVTLS